MLERISEGNENFELISQDENNEMPFNMFPVFEGKTMSNDNFLRRIEFVRAFLENFWSKFFLVERKKSRKKN